jgi:hypothetical protein
MEKSQKYKRTKNQAFTDKFKSMVFLIISSIVFYIAYTLHFAIQFNKTETHLSNNQILVHNILIWLIPFFWIMILKTLLRPIPRSNGYKKRKNIPGFYESEIGVWGYDDSHSQDGAGDQCSGGDD